MVYNIVSRHVDRQYLVEASVLLLLLVLITSNIGLQTLYKTHRKNPFKHIFTTLTTKRTKILFVQIFC